MQKLFKYILIFSICLFFNITLGQKAAYSYETCIITFPYGTWETILYKKTNKESLVQFILNTQNKYNYNETVIFHGYKIKVWMQIICLCFCLIRLKNTIRISSMFL